VSAAAGIRAPNSPELILLRFRHSHYRSLARCRFGVELGSYSTSLHFFVIVASVGSPYRTYRWAL